MQLVLPSWLLLAAALFFEHGKLLQYLLALQFLLNLLFQRINGTLTIEAGNIKLTLLLWRAVGGERGRCEDESQFLDIFQLLFEFLKGIDGEARCRNGKTAAWPQLPFEVVVQRTIYVVYQLHQGYQPAAIGLTDTQASEGF